jgi:hypothetical protein
MDTGPAAVEAGAVPHVLALHFGYVGRDLHAPVTLNNIQRSKTSLVE